jgi:hypothetical protein
MEPTEDRFGFARDSRFELARGRLARADLGELVRRYLAAFGPAAPADFETWSGRERTGAAFDALRDELATFADEAGRELFDLPDAPRPGADADAPVRLLPEFDNLLLSHADRTRVIADEHRPRVTTKNLRIKATFLVDGFVAGTWSVERKRRAATLVLEPFGKLAKRTLRELEREGESLLELYEPDAAERSVQSAHG